MNTAVHPQEIKEFLEKAGIKEYDMSKVEDGFATSVYIFDADYQPTEPVEFESIYGFTDCIEEYTDKAIAEAESKLNDLIALAKKTFTDPSLVFSIGYECHHQDGEYIEVPYGLSIEAS